VPQQVRSTWGGRHEQVLGLMVAIRVTAAVSNPAACHMVRKVA
jgi:hypothetical protein